MTITELRQKFIDGSYTPSQAVADSLATIEAKDADISAYIDVFSSVTTDAAAADAIYKDTPEAAGPLTGIPLAIKNNIMITGERVTAGSKMLEHYTGTYDATIIARLKEAGAILVGSTNLDEFAMGNSTENSALQVTKNPLDHNRVPGGSSGGSAAAVAMGSVPAAIGTDTGGSVRQPASFCGLVGFKPTYGAVSRYGLIAMGSSFDQAGPLTNSVSDAELLHSVMSGHDPMDMTTITDDTYPAVPLKEIYRVGIPQAFLKEGIDPDVKAVFEDHVTAVVAAGHEVVDIDLPLFEKGLAAYYISIPAEVSSNLARFDGIRYGLQAEGEDLLAVYENSRAAGLGPEVKRRILLGTYVLSAGYYDAFYGKAEAARVLMRAELNNVFKQVDTILLPTAPTPAFKIGEHADPLASYAQDIFTVPISLAGVPAISIPGGTVNRDGTELPVGVQYIAPHAGDARLFDLGKKLRGEV